MRIFRKKSIIEVTNYLLSGLNDISEQISFHNSVNEEFSSSYIYNKLYVKYLSRISRIRDAEIERFASELNSDEMVILSFKIRSICRDILSKERNVPKEDFLKLEEAIKSLQYKIESVLRDKDFSQYKLGNKIGEGRFGIVYEVFDNPNLVIKVIKNSNNLNYPISVKNIIDQLPNEINTPRILKIGYYNGSSAYLMQRVRGNVVHDSTNYKKKDVNKWSEEIELLANVPQEHYNKLLSDFNFLIKFGIVIDDSKSDNLFYDHGVGFVFIDLELGRLSNAPDIASVVLSLSHIKGKENQIGVKDSINLKTIVEKLSRAGCNSSLLQTALQTANTRHI